MEAQKVNREKLEGGSICGVNVFYFCFSLFSPNLIVLSPRTNALIPTVDSISCQGTWQTAHAYTSCGSRILLLPVQPLPFLDAREGPHHIVRRRGVLISPTRHDSAELPHNHRPRRSSSAAWRGQLTLAHPQAQVSVRVLKGQPFETATASSKFPPSPR